ncbi:MAG: universal stress protein, partial [Verrucomicrobiota bacterium]
MPVAAVISTPGEAEGLIRWSLLIALSLEEVRVVVIHDNSITKEELDKIFKVWAAEHPTVPEVVYEPIGTVFSFDAVDHAVHEVSPTMLVLGQNRHAAQTNEKLEVLRRVYDRAHCDSVMFRLSSQIVDFAEDILIPTAGGPHSRSALRLSKKIADRFKGKISPLYIEPNIGEEDGQAVGQKVLKKMIDQSGIDVSDRVEPLVEVADRVGQGIYQAAKKENFDLILIGASNSLVARRKLFGSIPEQMLEGEDPVTVAIYKRRRALQHRFKAKMERFLTMRIPQVDREQRVAVFERLQTQSIWSFDFLALILLSTGIASLGLIQSSPAVVIGAMLVAPLMTPLLGSGLSLVHG